MAGVAIGAGDAGVGMDRQAPLLAGLAAVVFMALQAGFAPFGRGHPLETADQARFFAACADVFAAGAMAGFARLLGVHALSVILDERLVAGGAELVVVDHFRVRNLRDRRLDLFRFALVPVGGRLDGIGRFRSAGDAGGGRILAAEEITGRRATGDDAKQNEADQARQKGRAQA